MKELVRSFLRTLGYRIQRYSPGNRFDATKDSLLLLHEAGFTPKLVIDGGANRGQFYRLARRIFPSARFHLIEPQPECAPELRKLVGESHGTVQFHPVAITEPGIATLRMVGGGGTGGTGCWVAKPTDQDGAEIEVPATSLDELLGDVTSREDRVLLKLDLESHEIPALEGASQLLTKVETILTEVTFYDVEGWGHRLFADTLVFLQERGYQLYDIAALSHRPRDFRLRSGDAIFVRKESELLKDHSWE